MSLTAFGLNCTLKSGDAPSSTQSMLDQVLEALAQHDVRTSSARVVDYDVKPGVSADEGDGDAWPALRARLMAAEIFVIATPIWVGHPSSIAQRVLERLDAVLDEIGDDGRYPTFGKVAIPAVVGNEDGAHKIVADMFQGLNDIGFTIPAQGCTYWNNEAMNPVDYKDLDSTPSAVASTITTLSSNAVHLARFLRREQYPAV